MTRTFSRGLLSGLLLMPVLAGLRAEEEPPQLPPAKPLPELITHYHPCQHVRGGVLKEILDTFTTPRGKVTWSEALNTLVVTDEEETLKQIREALALLDRVQPQVQVEARIVEVTLDSDFEKEINLTFGRTIDTGEREFLQSMFDTLPTPGAGTDSARGLGINSRLFANRGVTERLDSFIRLLVTQNKAKILSSPNIIVDSGSESSIITGEEVPIQTVQNTGGTVSTSTTFKRVGIKLKVRPLQIGPETVRLEVAPEVSSITGFTTPGATPGAVSNPIVAVRNTKTVLSLKDGQTLVIGGLKRQEKRHITRSVPILGSIPILGWFFRSDRDQTVNTSLIFYLRVQILKDLEAPGEPAIEGPDTLKQERDREKRMEHEHDRTRQKKPW